MKSKSMDIPENVPVKKELLKNIQDVILKINIDELCKTHGHILARLLHYYYMFNSIEIIWGAIKERL